MLEEFFLINFSDFLLDLSDWRSSLSENIVDVIERVEKDMSSYSLNYIGRRRVIS